MSIADAQLARWNVYSMEAMNGTEGTEMTLTDDLHKSNSSGWVLKWWQFNPLRWEQLWIEQKLK